MDPQSKTVPIEQRLIEEDIITIGIDNMRAIACGIIGIGGG